MSALVWKVGICADGFSRFPDELKSKVRAELAEKKLWPVKCMIADDLEAEIRADVKPWTSELDKMQGVRFSEELQRVLSGCPSCEKLKRKEGIRMCSKHRWRMW